jgi:phenylacetate-CoA ligase
MVRYAYSYVPFYHGLYKRLGIRPGDVRCLSDLEKLPLVSKDMFRENWDDFISRAVEPKKCKIFNTSGTTGTPTKILKNETTEDLDYASVYYAFFECGLNFKDRYLEISSTFRNSRKRVFRHGPAGLMKGRFLLSHNDLAYNVKNMLKINPTAIYTAPKLLEVMLEDYGSKLKKVHPRLVFTQGEKLTDKQRKLIGDCWGIKPNETYGSREILRLAFECNDHHGLHILSNRLILELVEDGVVVGSGERGETVVTSLYDFGMPFIRYRLGDLARWSDDECSCGRSWPLLKAIEGRIRRVFILPSGKKIIGNWVAGYIKRVELGHYIKRHQIIYQQSKAHLMIKLVCHENIQEKEKTLLEKNVINVVKRVCFYEDIFIEVCFVSSIPPQPSGKIPDIILES